MFEILKKHSGQKKIEILIKIETDAKYIWAFNVTLPKRRKNEENPLLHQHHKLQVSCQDHEQHPFSQKCFLDQNSILKKSFKETDDQS